jgi:hypothetical protein
LDKTGLAIAISPWTGLVASMRWQAWLTKPSP